MSTFAYGSKNLFLHIEFTVQILSKSITSNSVIFAFFLKLKVFYFKVKVILIPKKISENLKLRVRYFFGTSFDILRGKNTKIVRVMDRSIWSEMPHKH